ncbi:hypothetical protein E3P99_00087 [Wallemia hederae]|uniref:5-hydroxyisourate hydrolase n=1 Tax=Wallemia hederae TaxID=1540922 RepID=A0A4T0G2J9_9BASI|nr:hypothetical protein E3P99_00087 [Wallemia hederae]
MHPSETSPVTAHVLNTVTGKPAQGISVEIISAKEGVLGRDTTNENGRCNYLLKDYLEKRPQAGAYTIRFHTPQYWTSNGFQPFHTEIDVNFYLADSTEHYHIPLLISPASYTTYRGS